jgi:AcrR family transcriptional regulator
MFAPENHVADGSVATAESEKQVSSLRHIHKRRTRKVLREAAMELFLAQGYDSTTTEEIAAKAGVSVRTFFRYFETKDEVLFQGQQLWSDSLAEIFWQQPESLSTMEAMCATLVSLASGLDREAVIRYEKVVETSMTLRGRSSVRQSENVQRLADALAQQQGLEQPDATCRLVGAVCVLLYRLALEDWRAGGRKAQLEDLIVEKFGILAGAYDADSPVGSIGQLSLRKPGRRD